MPLLIWMILLIRIHNLMHGYPTRIRITFWHSDQWQPKGIVPSVIGFRHTVMGSTAVFAIPFLTSGKTFFLQDIGKCFRKLCTVLFLILRSSHSCPPSYRSMFSYDFPSALAFQHTSSADNSRYSGWIASSDSSTILIAPKHSRPKPARIDGESLLAISSLNFITIFLWANNESAR